MILDEKFTLVNGVEMQKIAFGTWQIPNGDICYNAVSSALKSGYRFIDTAAAYENEESVGKAIKDSGIKREEIFISTKLPAEIKNVEDAKKSFEASLKFLQTDYIDLYLIHAPKPWREMHGISFCNYFKQNVAIWKLFEQLYKEKKIRAIGVSNFGQKDLQNIFANCEIKPMVNQIRCHVGHMQRKLVAFSKENGMQIMAYSPLATSRLLKKAKISAIASKYNATNAQLCLKYVVKNELIPLPKSTHAERIISNTKLDFDISAEDMATLDKFFVF